MRKERHTRSRNTENTTEQIPSKVKAIRVSTSTMTREGASQWVSQSPCGRHNSWELASRARENGGVTILLDGASKSFATES